MNKYGESGSPCLNSHLHLKGVLGWSLTNIEEKLELSEERIQPHHFLSKPWAWRTCRRKDQLIMSKALVKSSLRKNADQLYLVHTQMISWADVTLQYRPSMNKNGLREINYVTDFCLESVSKNFGYFEDVINGLIG